ncbi:MAG: hypothetical protein JRC93_09995 [Deltaproteobacteria bacterium]|nr:hypothetical protein [Deltaproteobacteria bacterium]
MLANEMGVEHWKVSTGYGVFQLIVGVSVLVVRPIGTLGVVVLLAAWFGGFAGMSFYLRRKLATDPHKTGTDIQRLIAAKRHKRRKSKVGREKE